MLLKSNKEATPVDSSDASVIMFGVEPKDDMDVSSTGAEIQENSIHEKA